MAKKKSGIPGLSFSWRKATGVTSAKEKSPKLPVFLRLNRDVGTKVGKILGIK